MSDKISSFGDLQEIDHVDDEEENKNGAIQFDHKYQERKYNIPNFGVKTEKEKQMLNSNDNLTKLESAKPFKSARFVDQNSGHFGDVDQSKESLDKERLEAQLKLSKISESKISSESEEYKF